MVQGMETKRESGWGPGGHGGTLVHMVGGSGTCPWWETVRVAASAARLVLL